MAEVAGADPREAIRGALAAAFTPEQTSKLIDEVLAITKNVHVDAKCPACDKRFRTQATINDSKAVTQALTDWLNQGYGRPQEAAGGDDEKIVFSRTVTLIEPDGS